MGKQTSGFSLPGFVRLAPSIYVQDAQLGVGGYHAGHGPTYSDSSFYPPPDPAPKHSSRSRDTAPPDLIIITSWTGAVDKHVAKYTAAYNTLYPGVPILVITTVLSDFAIHSTKHKLKVLASAVDYLLSQEQPIIHPAHSLQSSTATLSPPYHHHQLPPPFSNSQLDSSAPTKPRFSSLLLHAFSEGGAHKAVLLARAYLSLSPTASRLPVEALILDSTPGTASYARATTAFARALPTHHAQPRLTKLLGTPLAAGVVGLVWAGLRGDEVVDWGDVHRHGVESAGLEKDGGSGGDGVEGEKMPVGSLMVRFKRTEHCAHAKGVVNGGVYWAAVRRTWEMRVDAGMGLRMGLGRRLSLDSLCFGGDEEGEW
ncbi:hypothetical protein C8A01DRAFT_15381 [Parachaetomium inaequale]|uniref:DUF829-domain-containing protein n=1 Tax=Parachaetomium inaequale TaxID=2588326 RepID=A0AAN6PGZ0_9PEZI|nr:hypothetical protein C8A01DRAFT_15381 [Parachaetomium inaequale]